MYSHCYVGSYNIDGISNAWYIDGGEIFICQGWESIEVKIRCWMRELARYGLHLREPRVDGKCLVQEARTVAVSSMVNVGVTLVWEGCQRWVVGGRHGVGTMALVAMLDAVVHLSDVEFPKTVVQGYY